MSRLKNNNYNYKIIARKSYNIFVVLIYFVHVSPYIHTFYFKKDNA